MTGAASGMRQEFAAASSNALEECALSLDGVGKRFDDGGVSRWVVRDVTATIRRGQALALWGPSGAGKSTLLNLVGGVLTPEEGAIVFNDADGDAFAVSSASERERTRYRRRHLGFVFQFFNLVPTLTVAENVLLPLELNAKRTLFRGRAGRDQAAERRRSEALARLDALGLGHCKDRFPSTLSGGEQQRAALARALAHEPSVVLADEPTGNLDRANAERVADLMWQLLGEAGCALVVATHNERTAARADSVLELG